MRILIAEDERITRRSIQKQLEGWGYDVVAAEDGAQAWERFQEQAFDIVVTDWDMPRLDGRELIRRIRDSGRAGYAYLIMLTGRSEKSDLVAGMEAGADDFLAKPFDKNELRVRLSAGERIIRLERSLAAQNEVLQKANERMKRDLDAAALMQRSMLPADLPQALGARFAWYYEPCDELGGDTLNIIPFDARSIGMYLLDVSGHGVPAALLSVTLNRVLATRDPSSSILFCPGPSTEQFIQATPSAVATRLNQQFPMEAQQGKYFTLAYAIIDSEINRLRYVLGGHPAPILAREGECPRPLDGDGFPIGVIGDPEFEDHSIQLEVGDRLYFYSDGITEAMNAGGDALDTEGLIRLIDRTRNEPLQANVKSCIEQLKAWCSPAKLVDDVTLLALEITNRTG